jgi:hypothetical protein
MDFGDVVVDKAGNSLLRVVCLLQYLFDSRLKARPWHCGNHHGNIL